MLRKTTLMLTLLLILISLTAVSAQDNSTLEDVLQTDFEEIQLQEVQTDETLTADSPGNFSELSDLIESSKDDVINLDKDYKYVSGDNVSSTGVAVNRTITINGNGHTIDASNAVRIFSVSASNVVLNNITFINGYTSNSGGAIGIGSSYVNLTVNDCSFKDNYAASGGGAIYSAANSTEINNCNFYSNDAKYGGSVDCDGAKLIINNSSFKSDYANYGGSVYVSGADSVINNTVFDSSEAYASGGSIYWRGTRGNLANSVINSSSATYGGSIFWTGAYANVINTTFDSSNASRFGGAVYFYGSYPTIKDSVFKSNTAGTSGGGIYCDEPRMNVNNCTFEGNNATAGGAIVSFGSNPTITNSDFKSNAANTGGSIYVGAYGATISNSNFESDSAVYHGGSIFVDTYNTNINNSTFINSSASSGGGVYMVYRESTTTYNSNNNIRNSRFINNTATYGGAGVTATDYATITNSTFTGNRAGNYGGAVDLTNSRLVNSTLEDNSAFYGGGVYIYNSDIINSTFRDNTAMVGNAIYILNMSNLVNNDVSDEDIFIFENETSGSVTSNDHGITSLMTTTGGYFAYCAERYNTSPYSGVIDHSMEKLKNSINHEPVGEYLKILIYQYVDHMDDLRNHDFHDYVWAFTDNAYWNSTDPIVKEVIRLYDSGFRVSTEHACKVLANGTLMYFNFSSMITPSGQQNLFLFKFDHGDVINETLTKEALNKTAFIGDYVEYRIVVSNKGTSPIYDLWIEDKDYSNGLVYETWRPEIGNWTYNNQTGHWIVDVLEPAKSASVILTFRVMVNGTLYNNATSGLGTVNVTNSTNNTRVYNRNFTVEKIALNKTVQLGNQTIFEILVRNTGDIELTEVFIEEESYDGLVYDSWDEDSYWTHRIINGKHRWYLNNPLAIDAYIGIRVIFNTTAYGNFTNVAVVGSNETENKTVNNTTKVLKPDFEVIKNVLTPYVQVGEQTIFEIVVRNTGEVELDDIVVIEDSYEGLIYNSTHTGDLWSHSIVNGKHTWKFNGILEPGEDEFFFVTFNTIRVGNFTNYVVATSNKTDNKTDNNTTVVNETVNETGNNSEFTVQKITVDKLVEVGQLVEFQILVKNTGNTVLHNVTIYESEYDGLTYWGYDDHFDFWTFNEEEMSWTLNSKFYPGEELGIHVYFNTTRIGNFTNCVVVSSNETDNKTANNTTKVVKPGISIEKIAINKTVVLGDQVIFEIVVHNVGEEALSDIVVSELEYEGLVYDSFVDYTGLWSKNDDLSWNYNAELGIGEYEGFFVVFNTTKRGNFTNIACVNGNDTDNDTVEIKDYNMSVSKLTLTKKVHVGEQTSFDIVVVNTGDLDLNDVTVREMSYEGLIYDSWKENDLWTYLYDDEIHFWKLNSVLAAGDSVTLTVIFNTTQRGNFTNIVMVESNETDEKEANNTTEVIESDFDVKKIVLTPVVDLGNQAVFEIIVRNTGEADLSGVFVTEVSYEGLVYDSWARNDNWIHSVVDGKHRWDFIGVLPVDEVTGFRVFFNTTSTGNFTNIVVSGSNATENKTANNTTEVLNPDFEVVKNTLTPTVKLGEQVIFEIVVRNTGEVDLDDITVIEDSYEGLVYDSSVTGDKWIHSVVGGKNTWKFNGVLKPELEEFFFVIFNTTEIGIFTNYVVASSNKTDDKTANNTTHVKEEINETVENPDFTVTKITITPEVTVGDLVEFQIVVKNTGDTILHNLTVYEDSYPGLVYYDYIGHFGYWDFNQDDMSWTLNTLFYPGEELAFHVFFNATSEGTFTNYVVASSNSTENKSSNDTVKVLKPQLALEKIAINKTVVLGNQVIFEIVVHNIGEVPYDNIVVRELEFDGLIYDSFDDNTGLWLKNDDLSWTLTKQLDAGEYEGFFVIFNTIRAGNFTNYVICDNKTANDTVEVLLANLTVAKITLNQSVVVGNLTVFEIIVTNNGEVDLDGVFVCESKYDSGLVYVGYVAQNWSHRLTDDGKHVFTLLDTLKAGDSASFRVIFNTTAVGNFTNTVEAGFNNKTIANSTNVTEVTNITLPDRNKTGPGNKSNPTNGSDDSDKGIKIPKTRIDEKATGNPLIALLLALIFIPLRRFKK